MLNNVRKCRVCCIQFRRRPGDLNCLRCCRNRKLEIESCALIDQQLNVVAVLFRKPRLLNYNVISAGGELRNVIGAVVQRCSRALRAGVLVRDLYLRASNGAAGRIGYRPRLSNHLWSDQPKH